MRTIVTLILILFLLTNTNGQKYFSFKDTGAIWSVNIEKFSSSGDTLIKGIKYKKFYETVADSIFSLDKASYFTALREDSSKKVMVIRDGSQYEKLLYDFSLKLGDTAVVYPYGYYGPEQDSSQIKIAQVDSILINLSYRKRYKIIPLIGGTWIPEYWIEGIGSTLGIFNAGFCVTRIMDVGYPELLCFSYKDTINYFGAGSNCFVPVWTDLKTKEIEKSICSFLPNPFIDRSILHISGVNSFNFVLQFYNIFGSLIRSYQITRNDFVIDRGGLSSGIYLYKLMEKQLNKDIGKIIIK